MKSLLLMRHAQARWKQTGLADRGRPLNKDGRRDARRMGDLLRQQDLIPEWIVCSAAMRARETAERVAEAAGYHGEILHIEQLYGAEPSEYLAALRAVPAQVGRALLIGHNPGIEDLLELLTGQWERLPTAAIVHLYVSVERWVYVGSGELAQLVHIWRPRELP
jgi:phosphohistidine phosphatase